MTDITARHFTGRHLLIVLGGFFGTMLAVNGVFTYFAVSTFNGVDRPDAYREGLQYNARIDEGRRQSALGWVHRVALGEAGRIEVRISDGQGQPVPQLAITGDIGRPAADRFTHPLSFSETSPGFYAATAEGLAPGSWVLSLDARKRDLLYRIKERLWLKPE
ncbi:MULTISPECIES: FixH family protein [Rhodomicrobium]|uniref:FixH family protein n=1 Tax=Rhodomicrobium TaxID=1068 RepID=UPI000B4B4CB8|nr:MULTISPECIES: FixH family protein [Rhodomicrobium]